MQRAAACVCVCLCLDYKRILDAYFLPAHNLAAVQLDWFQSI